MNLYLDTSALVKRYVSEEHSETVFTIIRNASTHTTSVLARVEVPAAIARSARLGNISRLEGIEATNLFAQHWRRYGRIGVGEGVIVSAAGLAWSRELRGFDAVHLAAALLLRSQLDDDITFATFDRALWRAARDEGLDAWPPSWGD